MFSKIVFVAIFAISSAVETENHQEIAKSERFFDPWNIFDPAINGGATLAAIVFGAAILLFSLPIIFNRLRRYEYKRQDEIQPYQEGYYSDDQSLQNRYRRFAPNGKDFLFILLV